MLEHYFVKPATVDRIRANVAGAYIEHYVSLASISPPPLAAFLVERSAGLARTTRRDLCGTLRIFLRYCHRERIINVGQLYNEDDGRTYSGNLIELGSVLKLRVAG